MFSQVPGTNHSSATFPILSRDPNPSRKPPQTQANGRFLKRTMVEKNGESTLRIIPSLVQVWSSKLFMCLMCHVCLFFSRNCFGYALVEGPFCLLGFFQLGHLDRRFPSRHFFGRGKYIPRTSRSVEFLLFSETTNKNSRFQQTSPFPLKSDFGTRAIYGTVFG